MNNQPVYAFTIRDELERVDKILTSHCSLVRGSEPFNDARQYVVAKVLQNIFLVVATVQNTGKISKQELDRVFGVVQSKYYSTDNGFNFNLEQDVGSNKLFYTLRSDLIPAFVRVEVREYNVVLSDDCG